MRQTSSSDPVHTGTLRIASITGDGGALSRSHVSVTGSHAATSSPAMTTNSVPVQEDTAPIAANGASGIADQVPRTSRIRRGRGVGMRPVQPGATASRAASADRIARTSAG